MLEPHIAKARTQFGRQIRQLRQEQQLTLHELGERIQVTEPAIVAVEQGKRAVGDSLANRLAAALSVTGDRLATFLLLAAATRKSKRLIGNAVKVPPEVTHFALKGLEIAGVPVCATDTAQILKAKALPPPIHKGIAIKLNKEIPQTLQNPNLPVLQITTGNGNELHCILLIV